MDSKQKIEALAKLFQEREQIDNRILEVMSGKNIEQKDEVLDCPHPKRIKRAKGIKFYVCADCGDKFKSNLERLDVRCLKCQGINIDYDREPEPPVKVFKLTKKRRQWTEDEIADIISMHGSIVDPWSFAKIAKKYGVSTTSIHRIYQDNKK